jgi:glycosyltransferase involved in cell wall biosynthesis
MKILVLMQCTNLGGMEQSTLLLMEEMKKCGHTVELLSLHEMGALAPLLEEREIPFSALGYKGKWGWRSFFPLKRLLRGKSADAFIMVGHNMMATLALGDLCKGNRLLLLHFHHQGIKAPMIWRGMYRIMLKQFDRIVYPSQFIRREALQLMPRLQFSKKILSYPIVSPIRMPALSQGKSLLPWENLKLNPSEKYVGNAGWLIPRKRWDIFLRVAAEVASVVPEACFLIAGDGPMKEELMLLAEELKLQDRIIWLGWQQDLDDFYRVLDVMLFHSDWDAMGRTPLEAMSYGVPVVASVRHGGLKEILRSEEHGFFMKQHDIPSLAAQVITLLQDQKLATTMGENARKHIEKVSSPRLHAERILKLLKNPPTHRESHSC